MDERTRRALSYINSVHEKRRLKATWMMLAIEICLVVYSLILVFEINF